MLLDSHNFVFAKAPGTLTGHSCGKERVLQTHRELGAVGKRWPEGRTQAATALSIEFYWNTAIPICLLIVRL